MAPIENIDFSVNRVLNNSRIPYESRSLIRAKLHETSEFIFNHKLEGFFNGSRLFDKKEIIKLIPEESSLYGNLYNKKELYQKLSAVSRIEDTKIIKNKIRNKIRNLISDESFHHETGSFKFIDPKKEEEIIYKNHINLDVDLRVFKNNEYIAKNWINSLSVIALIKWIIYSKDNDRKLTDTVRKGLRWIEQNSDIYFENYYGWNEYFKGVSRIYKTCETCLSLQTLLRALKLSRRINFKFTFEKFTPFLETILRLQIKDGVHAGGWPSEIIFSEKEEDEYVFDGLVGATAAACQFLCDCLTLLPDHQIKNYHKQHIIMAIKAGREILIKTQDVSKGCWFKKIDNNMEPSIDFTTSAIQALVKIRQINECHTSFEIDNSVEKGLEWLASDFCLITIANKMEYAWPKEGIGNVGCEKNTSLAVSTLLKAGVPPDTYIVRKSILWLLDAEPEFRFENVYVYCAILEYLKALERQ